MSWSAHDFELYVIQRHLGVRVSLLPLLVGNYAPDALTKWFVYGIEIGGIRLAAADPAQFHRGWPGAGFTHSILFAMVVALVALLITRNRVWGLSVLIGALAHSITDINDTLGTMLFWPFWTERISTGMWAYAAQVGRYDDAGAYYSSLGLAMDSFWFVIALLHWRVLTKDYFWAVVAPADPLWGWLGRRFPEAALLAFYRAGFFYGTSRLIAWTIWAHVQNSYVFDFSWGGPSWIPAVTG